LPDAGNRVGDTLQALFELQSIGIQRWSPIIGQRTPDCQTIRTYRFSLFIRASLQRSLDGTYSTDLFLQFFFGVPVCISNRFGGFS